MKIPVELLAEKNYEGTRLLEVTDPKALELRAKIAELQPEATPFAEKVEEYSKILDPDYQKIGELQRKINEIREKTAPTRALLDAQVAELEKIEQRAQLLKDKLQPLINSLIKDQLGEFERADQLVERNGKLYVEITDELEEKIKLIRANKNK